MSDESMHPGSDDPMAQRDIEKSSDNKIQFDTEETTTQNKEITLGLMTDLEENNFGCYTGNEQDKEKLSTLNDKLPELNQETMESIGIPVMSGQIDIERCRSFKKEGRFSLIDKNSEINIDEFRIIKTEDDSVWLLKNAPLQWRNQKRSFPKIRKLNYIRNLQGEVRAFKIGELIDYPIPETYLVQQEDRPWLAYKYYEGAHDGTKYFFDQSEESLSQITNPEDAIVRPLYNALAGAIGDSAMQGIVDRDGKYYGQDIGANPGGYGDFDEKLSTMMKYLQDDLRFGKIQNIDQTHVQKAVKNFVSKLNNITPERAAVIYEGYIGSETTKQSLIKGFVQNAQVLREACRQLYNI